MFKILRFLLLAGTLTAVSAVIYFLGSQNTPVASYVSNQAVQSASARNVESSLAGPPAFETPAETPSPQPAAESASKPAPQAAAKTPATKTSPAPKSPSQNPAPAPKATAACTGAYIEQFVCLLNKYRVSQGKGKLTYSANLARVGTAHSTWMSTTGIFSHISTGGLRFIDRCKAANVDCRAENLAKNASSPQNLLDMWKASPSHNTNLLGPYTTIGLGISGAYVTSLFN